MASSGSFTTSNYDGRSLTFNWSVASQNVANNQTTINWNLVGSGNASASWYMAGNFSVNIEGNEVFSSSDRIRLYDGTLVAEGSYTFTHNDAGEFTFSASAQAGIYTYAVNVSGSGDFALPTIARASQPSCITYPNTTRDIGNIGSTITIHMNRKSASFTHKVKYYFGNSNGTIATGVTNNCRWTIPDSFYTQIPNANTGVGEIAVETYNGSTYIGTKTVQFVCHTTNVNPTINDPTYRDTNTTTRQITGNNQIIIQNKSTLQFTIPTASAKKSATISSYQLTINGQTRSISAGTYNWGTLDANTNTTAVLKVTDSRGNTVTKNISLTIWGYTSPTALCSVVRENNYYSKTTILVKPNYSDYTNNHIHISLYYKKTNEENYSNAVDITPNVEKVMNFDNNFAWNIRFVVADTLTPNAITYDLFLSKGQPIFFVDTKKQSVGINCFPENDQSLELNGKSIFDLVYPVGSIYMSICSVNPSTLFGGTWVQITGRFLLGAGQPENNNNTAWGSNLTWNGSQKFNETVGSTGGESLHTLSTNEMPTHRHNSNARVNWYNNASSSSGILFNGWGESNMNVDRQTTYTDNQGGGSYHNNMPPYFTVNIWRRTA